MAKVASYGAAEAARPARTGGKDAGRAAVLSVMLCVLAAATVALNRTPAPVALEAIKDLDAPNALDEQILVRLRAAAQFLGLTER